jgi:hypothetical protein
LSDRKWRKPMLAVQATIEGALALDPAAEEGEIA